MALLFMDGFDYLSTGQSNRKWDSAGYGALVTGVGGNGKAMSTGNVTKTLPSNTIIGFIGFHFNSNGPIAAGVLAKFADAGATQVDLRIDATGALFFTRNGTTIGSVGAPGTRLTPSAWYWIECKVKIDPTVGVAECKVNGVFVLNSGVTNLNTRNTANSYFNQVGVQCPSSQGWFDSFHCWDNAAATGDFSDYIGEHVVDTKLALTAGSNAAWTPNASTNVSRINEANPDDDSTYNSSLTPNQIDSFNFSNLTAASGTALMVAINTVDRVDDATPRVIKHYVKSSAAVGVSADISPSSTYMNHQTFFPTDPNTSAAWAVAGRNAAEFGYKEIS